MISRDSMSDRTSNTDLSESLEDYLKTISRLVALDGSARVRDIARQMQVNYPSVTGALRSLSQRGLVNYAPYEHVTLTAKGRRLAGDILVRHKTLQDFLVKVLGVEAQSADETACRMEHVLPIDVRDRFLQFLEFVDSCPQYRFAWDQGNKIFACNHGKGSKCTCHSLKHPAKPKRRKSAS